MSVGTYVSQYTRWVSQLDYNIIVTPSNQVPKQFTIRLGDNVTTISEHDPISCGLAIRLTSKP